MAVSPFDGKLVLLESRDEGLLRGEVLGLEGYVGGSVTPETRLLINGAQSVLRDSISGEIVPEPGSQPSFAPLEFRGEEIRRLSLLEASGLTQRKSKFERSTHLHRLEVELDLKTVCLGGKAVKDDTPKGNSEGSDNVADSVEPSDDFLEVSHSRPVPSHDRGSDDCSIADGHNELDGIPADDTLRSPMPVCPPLPIDSPLGNHCSPSPPRFPAQRFPTDYFIVDRVDESFHRIVADLLETNVVGVGFGGKGFGDSPFNQEAKLGWIQVANDRTVFLFDILSLGHDGFLKGLKTLFESLEVIKVVHDCRHPSDVLLRKFKVKLSNVFDVFAADCKIEGDENFGYWSLYGRRLSSILMDYRQNLKITKEAINFSYVRNRDPSLDERVFLERPPDFKVLEVLVRDVMYLTRLRQHMIERILTSVHRASDFCLSELRDESYDEKWNLKVQFPERVPQTFERLSRKKFTLQETTIERRRRRELIEKDVDSNGMWTSLRQEHSHRSFVNSHHSIPHGGFENRGPPKPVPHSLLLRRRDSFPRECGGEKEIAEISERIPETGEIANDQNSFTQTPPHKSFAVSRPPVSPSRGAKLSRLSPSSPPLLSSNRGVDVDDNTDLNRWTHLSGSVVQPETFSTLGDPFGLGSASPSSQLGHASTLRDSLDLPSGPRLASPLGAGRGSVRGESPRPGSSASRGSGPLTGCPGSRGGGRSAGRGSLLTMFSSSESCFSSVVKKDEVAGSSEVETFDDDSLLEIPMRRFGPLSSY